MTNREAFIQCVERAGIKMNYYIDTRDEKYMDEAKGYVRAANVLLEEMNNENN